MSAETVLLVLIAAALGIALGLLLARRGAPSLGATPLDPRVEEALKSLPQLQQDVGGVKATLQGLPSNTTVAQLAERLGRVESYVSERVPPTLPADLQGLSTGLTRLTTELRERSEREKEMQKTLGHIESVVAGAQSRGAAGEVILAEAFAQFPPEMGERQFKVNGRTVEFALVLPNRKRLAIDSKWPASKELEQYANATDPAERQELLEKIEKAVLKKVEEVTKYIDPATTVNAAVAAVPDAAYFACRTAHLDAYRQRVLLMPYSLTIPFLLALYNLHLQFMRSVDLENLDSYLVQVEVHLDQFEEKLENSVERGATMVLNAYQELRQRIGQMRGTIAVLRQLPTEALAEKQESLLKAPQD